MIDCDGLLLQSGKVCRLGLRARWTLRDEGVCLWPSPDHQLGMTCGQRDWELSPAVIAPYRVGAVVRRYPGGLRNVGDFESRRATPESPYVSHDRLYRTASLGDTAC